MKFLLAQINPVVGDLEGNAKKIITVASKASSISADFVLTPELSLWGYPANDLLFKNNLIKNQYGILDQLALDINKKYGNLSISIGIAEKVNGEADKFTKISTFFFFKSEIGFSL